jgi:hypothetical protein
MAYVLLDSLRRLALQATDLADATCGTIRRKLLKIGVLVTLSVRSIKFAMPSGYPLQDGLCPRSLRRLCWCQYQLSRAILADTAVVPATRRRGRAYPHVLRYRTQDS